MKFRKKLKIVLKKNLIVNQSVYNAKYLKLNRNFHNKKINKNFHNNKAPKKGPQFICLSVILIDSVFRAGKNYYPQMFLEECIYVSKEKKIPDYITYDIEIPSDSDREDCDEEISNEEFFVSVFEAFRLILCYS